MSRLDQFIARMIAQRSILNHIAADRPLGPGAILEVGLGNGRTYSHLRELFPDRSIVAFDRALNAHKGSHPDPEDMVLGEIRETAQLFVGQGAALVNVDIGTGYPDKDAITLTWLPDLVAGLLAPGACAVSGLPLEHPALAPLPLPEDVPLARSFLYQRRAD